MRRDSWRSVPRMCRPPAASTSCFSASHWALNLREAPPCTRPASRRRARAPGLPAFSGSTSARAMNSALPPRMMSVPRPAMLVEMVTAPLRPACATIVRLALVLLGVQHVVRDALLAQQRGDDLGLLDGDGADQHRLAALVAVLDLVAAPRGTCRARSCRRGRACPCAIIGLLVGIDRDVELVDLVELRRLGVGGAGHAGQLLVHAEVVLEADRRQRLVLFLDLDAFLGLDRLVQAVGPAAARHLAAGELVDDDDLAVLDRGS